MAGDGDRTGTARLPGRDDVVHLAELSIQVPGGFRAVRLARGTGLSLGDTIYVAAVPTATPKPATPAATPRL